MRVASPHFVSECYRRAEFGHVGNAAFGCWAVGSKQEKVNNRCGLQLLNRHHWHPSPPIPAHFAANSPMQHRRPTSFNPMSARCFLKGSSNADDDVSMESVEKPRLRWRTALWTQSRPGGGLFALQMRQNPRDYRRVFDASDDRDLPRAPLAGLDVDPDAAQLNTRFSLCIFMPFGCRSSTGGARRASCVTSSPL